MAQELVEQGHLGTRTGRGFYTYREGETEQITAEGDEKLIKLLQTLSLTASTPQASTRQT
jgi:3-hydroxyacyl-CoA dehydrogenase